LAQQTNVLFLAQKGRQFLGMIHMTVSFRPVGQQKLTAFVKAAYVIPSKRKLGVGKQLADQAMMFCRQSRIQGIEFLCDDKMLEFWSKKRGARKVANYALIEV
jgi:GNAT superfamily N-acetyltransferase